LAEQVENFKRTGKQALHWVTGDKSRLNCQISKLAIGISERNCWREWEILSDNAVHVHHHVCVVTATLVSFITNSKQHYARPLRASAILITAAGAIKFCIREAISSDRASSHILPAEIDRIYGALPW